MTVDDFTSKLTMRYTKLKSDPFQLTDIEEGLKTFSSTNREKLFTALKDNYILARAPRWADLNHLAIQAGIIRTISNPLKNSYDVCDICKTAYSAIGRVCPTCHKLTPFTVYTGRPYEFCITREDCGQCKLYEGNHTDGIICDDFGTKKSHTMPMCKSDCVCHRCCYETLAINQGLNGDVMRFDKLQKENKWEDRLLEGCKTL